MKNKKSPLSCPLQILENVDRLGGLDKVEYDTHTIPSEIKIYCCYFSSKNTEKYANYFILYNFNS